MTVLADARPPGLAVSFRPGNTLTLVLNWPSGELAGRSFTSTLGTASLSLSVDGDVMTIEASEAQTVAILDVTNWKLTETTGGATNDLLVGYWAPSERPGAPTTTELTVTAGTVEVEVSVHGTVPNQSVVRRWTQALSSLGAVLFVWDDGWTSAIDAAAINEERGQQVTFAITTGLVGTTDHMSVAQIQALAAAGHEIAAHGTQHSTGLPSLTAAQRATEYTDCLDWFEDNGIERPSTWVYTFGGASGRSDTTDQELWLRVDRLLDTSGSSSLGAATRRDQFGFCIKRLQAESDTTGVFDIAQALIRLAAQQPIVVAFYMHELNGSSNSLSTAEYTQLCDLCVELNVPVVTARDALPRNRMLVDGGFEETNAIGLWTRQTTGTSTATTETDTPITGLPGTKSLKLHTVDTGAFEFSQVFQHVPVTPGRVYTLSGRYRTSSGAGTAARVRFGSYDHKGVIIGSATTTTLSEATSWTRFAQDFTAASEAVNAQIALLNDPANNVTSDVWFDHVCLLPKASGAFG